MGGGTEPGAEQPKNMAEASHGPGQDRSEIKLSFPSTLAEGERGETEEVGEGRLQKRKESSSFSGIFKHY